MLETSTALPIWLAAHGTLFAVVLAVSIMRRKFFGA